jgi:hypothetical protein
VVGDLGTCAIHIGPENQGSSLMHCQESVHFAPNPGVRVQVLCITRKTCILHHTPEERIIDRKSKFENNHSELLCWGSIPRSRGGKCSLLHSQQSRIIDTKCVLDR